MPDSKQPIPIYTTSGNAGGFLNYPFIYNTQGEWIGWVTVEKKVYSVFGQYIGWLNLDRRILRRRSEGFDQPREIPPPTPARLLPPATVALPPMMAELRYDVVDVLDEMPDLMPTQDSYAIDDDTC
jgi:hypothetical protein